MTIIWEGHLMFWWGFFDGFQNNYLELEIYGSIIKKKLVLSFAIALRVFFKIQKSDWQSVCELANRFHGYIALNTIFQMFSHAHAFMLNNFFVSGGRLRL